MMHRRSLRRVAGTVTLAALTLVAFTLRLRTSLVAGLTRDEAQGVNIALLPDVAGLLRFLVETESHPPLFYLVLRGWMAVFGSGDLALSILAALLGAALVPVLWWAARTLIGNRAAWYAAVIAVVFPMHVFYSSLVRPYSLLTLTAVTSMVATWKLIETKGHAWAWTWGACAAMLMLTHTWTVLLVGAEILIGIVLLRECDHRRVPGLIIRAAAPILLLWGPWAPFFVHQLSQGGHGIRPGSFVSVAADGLAVLVGSLTSNGYGFPFDLTAFRSLPADTGLVLLFLWVLLLLLLLRGGLRRARADGSDPAASRVLLAIAVLSTGLAVVLSPWSWLLVPHPFAMFCPIGILLMSRALQEVRSRRLAEAGLAVVVTAVMATSLAEAVPRSNIRDVAAFIGSAPRDALVIVVPESYGNGLFRYISPERTVRPYPHRPRDGPLVYRGRWHTFEREQDFTALMDEIRHARSGGRDVWLVASHGMYLQEIEPPPYTFGDPQIVVYRLRQIDGGLEEMYGEAVVVRLGSQRARHEELSVKVFEAPARPDTQADTSNSMNPLSVGSPIRSARIHSGGLPSVSRS